MTRGAAGALAALAGACLTASFAPAAWYFVAPPAIAAALIAWRRAGPRAAFFTGWCFGAGFFGAGLHWMYVSLHDFGGLPPAPAALATALLAAALALYPAALAWCGTRLAPAGLAQVALWPSLWTLCEWLRGWLFTGFPWNTPGQAAVDSPLAGVLPLVGVTGATWLAVLLGAALAAGTRAGLAVFAAAALAAWGTQWLEWTRPAGAPLTAALVQPAIPQGQRFDAARFERDLALHRRMTLAAGEVDLVVWPEASLPTLYRRYEERLARPLADRLARHGGHLLLGAFTADAHGGVRNSLVLAGGADAGQDGSMYHKRHLVPFGEYLPFAGVLGFLRDFVVLPRADLLPGAGPPLLRIGAHEVGALICYEAIFAAETRAALPRAAYLVNVSNDSWFGRSLGPHQHLQMARARAAEAGRPLLRATTGGVSGIIDHKGRLLESAPIAERRIVSAAIQPRQGATAYALAGDWPTLAWSAFWVALCALRKWRSRRPR